MDKGVIPRHGEQQKMVLVESCEPDSGVELDDEILTTEDLKSPTELVELRLLILSVIALFFAFVAFHGDKPFRTANCTHLS
nr:expressed protein [Hymenolepis microstoma]CDS30373.1 hypothetical transcript [Hymenolepis microstoma]